MIELAADPRAINEVLTHIKGANIERRLVAVASIGGRRLTPRPELAERYAANRLALSADDIQARAGLIKPWMESAGMTTQEFPLGTIGVKTGTNPDLPPVVIMSHTDSIKDGDMYDGVLGVVAGIETVKALQEAGIQNRRTIMVACFTGEESARFNFALIGSRAFFHGLTDKELDSRQANNLSLREALGSNNSASAKQPLFEPIGNTFPQPLAALELHVEQDKDLHESETDIGIVRAVAAPIRHEITIGDKPLLPDQTIYPFSRYLNLNVKGISDHSGATPMGNKYRADGLVQTAQLLTEGFDPYDGSITIGDILIDDPSINRIPGITNTALRVTGKTEQEVYWLIDRLGQKITERNSDPSLPTRYGKDPFSLAVGDNSSFKLFFKPHEIFPRQLAALSLVKDINTIATSLTHERVVGTIGRFTTTVDGKIVLGMDLRGVEQSSRDLAMLQILEGASKWDYLGVDFGDRLSGSGNPVSMDENLVKLAKQTIETFRIGTSQIMVSGAGHDIQNAARADTPSLLLFCQSEGGIAHNPNAYTSSENLEKGAKALAALTLKMAL